MMRLEKAILIMSQWDKGTDPLYLPDLPDAVRLLIVAAERLNKVRSYGNELAQAPLPGEEPL